MSQLAHRFGPFTKKRVSFVQAWIKGTELLCLLGENREVGMCSWRWCAGPESVVVIFPALCKVYRLSVKEEMGREKKKGKKNLLCMEGDISSEGWVS